jgi:hypothetical protein
VRRFPLLVACLAAGAVVAGGAAKSASRASGETPTVPRILMNSQAGTQRAVQGSYCLAYVNENGIPVFGCGDVFSDLLPRRLSVVRPGERVQIRLRDARIILRSPGCGPTGRCEATVAVSRLGCRKIIARFDLKPSRTTWRARLEPGAYELSVFVGNFTTGSASGDTSGSLGLLVDRNRPRGIISARGQAICN